MILTPYFGHLPPNELFLQGQLAQVVLHPEQQVVRVVDRHLSRVVGNLVWLCHRHPLGRLLVVVGHKAATALETDIRGVRRVPSPEAKRDSLRYWELRLGRCLQRQQGGQTMTQVRIVIVLPADKQHFTSIRRTSLGSIRHRSSIMLN